MILFDGLSFAQKRETQLAQEVAALKSQGRSLGIAAVLFREDTGSVIYTRLKQEASERVGIAYQVHEFSMTDPVEQVITKIAELNQDPAVTGIIIQKPWRKRWEEVVENRGSRIEKQVEQEEISPHQERTSGKLVEFPDKSGATFQSWWTALTATIAEHKDVDGLHPNTIDAIKKNTWRQEHRVLPATCKAVLTILQFAFYHDTKTNFRETPIAIIGKSDLLGTPLYHELRNQQYQKVKLLGRKELGELVSINIGLKEFPVIISATGQRNLITGDMVSEGSIVIDVGEPQPDIERTTVKTKAKFLTPVPGGVGPMTIISLLENCIELGRNEDQGSRIEN